MVRVEVEDEHGHVEGTDATATPCEEQPHGQESLPAASRPPIPEMMRRYDGAGDAVVDHEEKKEDENEQGGEEMNVPPVVAQPIRQDAPTAAPFLTGQPVRPIPVSIIKSKL
jgi:hypothetical protein